MPSCTPEPAQSLRLSNKQAELDPVVKGYQFCDIGLPKALSIPAVGSRVEMRISIKTKGLGSRI